jgi:hypothetical protein
VVSGRTGELQRILGHKEWATPDGRKVDPSLNMEVRRSQVARRLAEVSGRPAPVVVPRPAPVPAPASIGPAPAWDLPRGHYLGHINGPAQSHGGGVALDRDNVLWVQRKWITLGVVPGITNPFGSWADARWTDESTAACRRWFARFRPSQPIHTQVWADDYAFLARQ